MSYVPPGVSLDDWAEAYGNRRQARVELRRRIDEAEAAYRRGQPIISDAEFDALVDELAGLGMRV